MGDSIPVPGPKEEIENVLWELGREKPELRVYIAEIVQFLRGRLEECARGQTLPILANRIRILCEQKGWNQKILAKKASITESTLSRILTGIIALSKENATKLSTTLGWDIFSPLPEESPGTTETQK